MNRKLKNIVLILIGIIIGSTIGVIGSNVISANQVGINSSKTTKTNMQDAIDELYEISNKKNYIYGRTNYATGATIVTSNLPTGVKAVVYLDPTDLSKSCTASNSVSTTGTKTGCMKWYVYNEDSISYTMILDHNSTAVIAWNSDGNNIYPTTIEAEISNLVNANGWKVTPRMISAQEIADITKNKTWNVSLNGSRWFYFDSNGYTKKATAKGKSAYAWLFDYTKNCTTSGCNIADSSTSGYWLSTPIYDSSWSVWSVNYDGNFVDNTYYGISVSNNTSYGLRPVITILK